METASLSESGELLSMALDRLVHELGLGEVAVAVVQIALAQRNCSMLEKRAGVRVSQSQRDGEQNAQDGAFQTHYRGQLTSILSTKELSGAGR